MGELWLHIGMGRCGSTSIQAFAARHRKALRERGVDYPAVGDLGVAGAVAREANGDVLFRASRTPHPEPVFRAVADYVAGRPGPVLMSSEGLFTADHGAMTGFRRMLNDAGARLRVVAYVREQTAWIVSRWAQGVKMGGVRNLDEELEKPPMGGSLNYPRRFEQIAAAYGAEAINPRVLDNTSLVCGDVRADLLALIGMEVADLVTGEPSRNASPAAEQLFALRRLNAEGGGPTDHRSFLAFSQAWGRDHGVTFARDLYRLGDRDRFARLRARYAPLNETFRADWLAHRAAPLFSPPFDLDYEPLDHAAIEATAGRMIVDWRRQASAP